MSEYRNPTPTVDVIIELLGDSIVLIERGGEPPGLALPGGFVDEGETVEAAAVREALEETGLAVELDALLYVYSDPARDPRKHTLSIVFVGHAEGEIHAGDDAREAFAVRRTELPAHFSRMAFDHAAILQDYLHFRDSGERPRPARPH